MPRSSFAQSPPGGWSSPPGGPLLALAAAFAGSSSPGSPLRPDGPSAVGLSPAVEPPPAAAAPPPSAGGTPSPCAAAGVTNFDSIKQTQRADSRQPSQGHV